MSRTATMSMSASCSSRTYSSTSRSCMPRGFGLASGQSSQSDQPVLQRYERVRSPHITSSDESPDRVRRSRPPSYRETPPGIPGSSRPATRADMHGVKTLREEGITHIPGFSEKKDWRFPPTLQAQRKLASDQRKAGTYQKSAKLLEREERRRLPAPEIPVSLPIDVKARDKVEYQVGDTGISLEGRAFFDRDVDMEKGEEMGIGTDWSSAELSEGALGLETGRIVETRRSGMTSLGMILASISMAGKQRLLMLRPSGEIWPISSHDVQFIMPASLVPPSLAEQCWSTDLLAMWARGEAMPALGEEEDVNGEEVERIRPMMDARRQAVMILRKISRETERMCGRLVGAGQGRGGGFDAAWEHFAPEDNEEARGTINAAQAAEYILNTEQAEQKITVKPNTLPAYAAHVMMMKRSDLFLADQVDMWDTGLFMVRSRAERRRQEEATKMIGDTEDRSITDFVDKAKAAITVSRKARKEHESDVDLKEYAHDLPEWTPTDLNIISIIFSKLYETRSTQVSPITSQVTEIVKAIGAYPDEDIDRPVYAKVLKDIGMLPPWDSLKASEARESEVRDIAMAGTSIPTEGELWKGHELDDLREDCTSHQTYVVDDATAKELDDGIAVESIPGSEDHWVHVHIADPTRYLPPTHPIAVQASFRGSTLYLPETTTPLLPMDIVMKELSLGADTPEGKQATMVFSGRLDSKGEIKDSKVRMAWIKKPRVVTYSAVDQQVLGVTGSPVTRPFGTPISLKNRSSGSTKLAEEEVTDLRLLHSLATKFRGNRMKNAGFDWQFLTGSVHLLTQHPESSQNYYDTNLLPTRPEIYTGNIQVDYSVPSSSSPTKLTAAMVIAECAILANRVASHFCSTNSILVLYRGSSAPKSVPTPNNPTAGVSVEKVLSSRDQLFSVDPYLLASSGLYFPPGEMSMKPLAHWSMGFTKPDWGYIRATSPLRRFEDMLVHWQIKAFLAKSKGIDKNLAPSMNANEIETLSKRSNMAERRVKKSSKVASAWWQAGLLLSRRNGPDAPGYDTDGPDVVDLREKVMVKVAAPTAFGMGGLGATTPVFVPSLGVMGRIEGKHLGGLGVGQEIMARLKGVNTFPNPMVDFVIAE